MDSQELTRRIFEASGLTKSALSDRSGISRSLLDAYLNGATQPSHSQLQRLAEASNVHLQVTVRARAKRISEQFIAVLEFGELFPRKPSPEPLNLASTWRAARERA